MEQHLLEEALATVHTLLQSEGMDEAAYLVATHPALAEETGYDNWNGGTEIWEIRFQILATEFARLGAKRNQLEEQITSRLRTVLEQDTHNWYSAKLVPAKEKRKDWRIVSPSLPKRVRTNIVDGLRLEDLAWYGKLDEVEFLSRLFDLQQLPSTDGRYTDAARDIWQHRVNNDDWERDWVFSDDRFNLLDGPAEQFLRFLCEVVHPIVRSDRDEVVRLEWHLLNLFRVPVFPDFVPC